MLIKERWGKREEKRSAYKVLIGNRLSLQMITVRSPWVASLQREPVKKYEARGFCRRKKMKSETTLSLEAEPFRRQTG